jgi:hypothetical protein
MAVLILPGNATAYDVLSGKKFNAGILYNTDGSMADYAGLSEDAVGIASDASGNLWLNPPEGHYDPSSAVHVQDADFVAANIKSGIDLFGITGTYNGIKSIQYVNIVIATSNTSNTAAINAVDVNNSVIMFLGSLGSDTSAQSGSYHFGFLALTNATTVTATRMGASASYTCTVRGVVIEFYSVTSKQSGSIALSTDSTTANITSVDTSKTLLFCCGVSSNDNVVIVSEHQQHTLMLTNATTITAAVTLYSSAEDLTVYWNLIVLI